MSESETILTMRGSLITALDHGHTAGRITVLDSDVWRCWVWEELGPQWIAIAVGDGASEPDARSLAEERLAEEVAKHQARGGEGEGSGNREA